MSELNFFTIKPAVAVGVVNGYVILPAFSYENLVWEGASKIVIQYNYSASKNFVLRTLPIKPTNPNYCLVIKYRIGPTVYRYKLWENVGENLPVDLYIGQAIKKNFCLEIWSTETNTIVSNDEEFNIVLSIRSVPISMANSVNYQDAGYTLGDSIYQGVLAGVYEVPATGLLAQYNSTSLDSTGAVVNSWDNALGTGFDLASGGGVILQPVTTLNSYPVVYVGGGVLSGNNPFNGITIGRVFALVQQIGWASGGILLETSGGGGSPAFKLEQHGDQPGIKLNVNGVRSDANLNLPINTWGVVTFTKNTAGGACVLEVDKVGGLSGANAVTQGTTVALGLGNFNIVEVLMYDDLVAGDDEVLKQAVYNYFYAKYRIGFPMPEVFSQESYWLDNE